MLLNLTVFQHTTDTAFANRDQQEEYHLRSYQVELKERDITRLAWKQDLALSEASFIVPSKFV